MIIERKNNAARNIVSGGVLKIYQILAQFFIRTAMIYFMGIQYLGLNSLFSSVLSVLNLAELGVGSAMVFSMYKPIAEDDSITICALMRLYRLYYRIIGIIILVVGLILIPFIPMLIKEEIPVDINIYVIYILNLMMTVFSYWLFAYKNSLFIAHQRVDIRSKITIITYSIQCAIQLFVIIIIKNYYIFLIVMIVIQIMDNILISVFADKYYPDYKPKGKLDKEIIKEINEHVKDLFTAKLASVAGEPVDTIIISAFLGLRTLVMYQNYYLIMNSICGFITVIFNAIAAGIGNSLIIETEQKNYNDFKKFTFIICWLLCICCCCFLGLFQPFMKLWMGEDLMFPYSFLIIFCIYFYLREFAMILVTIKDAAGLWHEDRLRPFFTVLVNFILSLILVNYIGIYGVTLGTVSGYVFVALPWLLHNLFILIYKISPKEYLKNLVWYLSALVISCAITTFCCYLIGAEGIIALLVNGAISLIVPSLVQVVIFRKKTEYKESINLIKTLLQRRRK